MATQILITDAGRAALVAPGNGGTSAHQVTAIGLANAPFVADKGLTKLPNELKRITTFGGANIAPDTIHATLKDDTADQYSLYGFGLYLENGVLLAAYGQATPIMEKSPAALLLLSTDLQFATIDATQLVFGDASFLNPPATTERQGVVELATQAEVDAGADDTRAVTPKTAATRYASLAGSTFTGDVWVDRGNANGYYVLNGMSETYRAIVWKTDRVTRWEMGTDNGAETGSNTGSHWYLSRIGDDGKWIDNVLWISRTTGVINFSKRPTVDGKTVWDAGNFSPDNYVPIAGGTMNGDLAFEPGKRLVLAEGGLANPSLTFANDGKPDTGLYHSGDGFFGVTCNGVSVARFTPTLTAFDQPVTGPTPAQGDRSTRFATTEWVLAALSTTAVGQIVFEPRATVRAGFLKANGALVNRADYPALWAYAQASGALVSDDEWQKGRVGCFSSGVGETTFRLPEMRGEFIRGWDDARGIDANRMIGSWQDSANRSHSHGASASEGGDHIHSAWTDVQGWHGHHGWTAGAGAHNHVNGVFSRLLRPPYPGSLTGSDQEGSGIEQAVGPNDSADLAWVNDHGHEFNTEGSGNHGHNIGIGWNGHHGHAITVNGDGESEARPRNVAMLVMIRAY
ncbi:phage tail protein [Burkholderia ubonensis]|uniref:Phage tail protein n=1 Tax=Burkholderia ubonensis subsp. mesacidophila TaxID=265293 RepID=A0A2A4FDC5_9BURK|nr:phage tail protein [Burkholderia ubonensis]PCE31145.1 hypothetical protein BZL54_18135 [Burkholderia ubonensis subsp. mesacidophila]